MEPRRGGLLSSKLSDDGGDSSQGTQSRSSRRTRNARSEWKDEIVSSLVDMCAENCWEYEPFKQANWVSFARELHTRFPEEPPRTWQQTRDKWVSMKTTYQEEKLKQQETGAPPSTWKPWYEIFDGMYNDPARLRRAPHSVDQGVYYPHSEYIVSDDDEDDDVLGTPPSPLVADATASQSVRSARKRKWAAGNESIASAIEDFSKRLLEIEKMKLRFLEKTLESERKSEREHREMMVKSQLEMAALFAEALKGKDSVGSSK